MYNTTTLSLRHDWRLEEILDLFNLPFNDLLFEAQRCHRQYFHPNHVQLSTLLNIKTGACPEDCQYCPQSAHYSTGIERQSLLDLNAVRRAAQTAKEQGATRFCMGAAWRQPPERDMPALLDIISTVKALGMETCLTVGMLDAAQAQQLQQAGLDYYNHNLDTSARYYTQIISTRTYQARLDTLACVRDAGIKVCAGGIIGMGENLQDRAELLQTLANLPTHPESVPINQLIKVEGTPLDNADDIDPLDFVRCIAVARILMPASVVRLSAGREVMSDELQAWCFFAGANSIFYGEKLLTTNNPAVQHDQQLLQRLGMEAAPLH